VSLVVSEPPYWGELAGLVADWQGRLMGVAGRSRSPVEVGGVWDARVWAKIG